MSFDRLKDVVDCCSDALWSLSFAGLGRLQAKRQPWRPSGGDRVLVVAPHPDDEAGGCAGTLLIHLRTGDEVAVVWVTDGGRSRALGLDGDEIVLRRRSEAQAAAVALGARHSYWFGLPEGSWALPDLELPLRQVFAQFRPELIYAPSLIDFHPEHQKVARAVASVVPRACEVRVFQIHVPLTSLLANVIVDVTEQISDVVRIFNLYETQLASLTRLLRSRRYAGCFYGVGQFVEEFWQMTAEAYRDLHVSHIDTAAFRGLRHRSLTDPLAYWRARVLRKLARDIVSRAL